MKHIFLFTVGVLLCVNGFAQEPTFSQFDFAILNVQPVLNVEKAKFMKDINMIANTRFSSTNNFADGSFQNSAFRLNELRMEIIGKVTDKVFFRFRDVYSNRSTDPLTTDGLRYSIDFALIEVEVNPKLAIGAGKMNGDWGSYEFDINPVFIHAYNHITNQPQLLFLTGAYARWKALPKHTFTFQVTNSSSRNLAETGPGLIPVGVEEAKAYLGETFNWRGKFFDDKFSTMWSFSHFNMAKDKHTYLLQMGNQYKIDRFVFEYDFKYSIDDLDRLGYTSGLLLDANNGFRAMDVRYMEHWVRSQYFFNEKWSATLIGMTNTQYWRGERPDALSTNRNNTLGTSYSFTAAVEYHIYRPYDLQIFASYVGRYNQYTDYARQQVGLSNNNTGQIFIGIISPLVFF